VAGIVFTFVCAFILGESFSENTWRRVGFDYFALNKSIFLMNAATTISVFGLLFFTSRKGVFPKRKR
jgi:hypothetical protein